MAPDEADFDHVPIAVATQLARGEISRDELADRLTALGARSWTDGEQAKVLLRGSFLALTMPAPIGGDESAIAMAEVARALADLASDRTISYGLAHGVFDSGAVAEYVLSLHQDRAGNRPAAVAHLAEAVRLSRADDDVKTVAQGLLGLARLEMEEDRHGAAAVPLHELLGILAGADPEDFKDTSLPEAVAEDMKNVYRVGLHPHGNLPRSHRALGVEANFQLAMVAVNLRDEPAADGWISEAMNLLRADPHAVGSDLAIQVAVNHYMFSLRRGDEQRAVFAQNELESLAILLDREETVRRVYALIDAQIAESLRDGD